MKNWILMIDNTPNNFDATRSEWIKHQLHVKLIPSMQEALKLLSSMDFLLVVIVADNLEYLPHLKLMRNMKPMPILVLASYYNAAEKLDALHFGADEYIASPTTLKEIVASGKALIRRYTVLNHRTSIPLTIITYHEILMCVEHRKLLLKGREIELTRKEFDLLHLLLSSIGRVYTHEQIYNHVWKDENEGSTENYAVWCLVARLRKKLRSVPDTIEYVHTVRDVGYRIQTIV